MTTTTNPVHGERMPESVIQYCQQHPQKKVKFYCTNDKEMFCSKCILKHTQQKHEVINCSPKGKLDAKNNKFIRLFLALFSISYDFCPNKGLKPI